MIHANLDQIEEGKEVDNKDVVNRFPWSCRFKGIKLVR